MNTMSLKEKAVLATVMMALLYAVAVALWFTSQSAAWAKAAKTYARAKATFEAGKATDTTWLGKMDALAAKHHISISQRQSGKEVESGEVLELPIEVRSWEGALESLVKFMHELENTDEGMFDIRSISFKPSSKKGYLKGSFTLTCAYMREK